MTTRDLEDVAFPTLDAARLADVIRCGSASPVEYPAPVSAVARTDCTAQAIPNVALRQIVNSFPTLGDVFLQAFIARRQILRASSSFTGLRVIGSRYSQDTFRVRDFLARNRVLFTWIARDAKGFVCTGPPPTPHPSWDRKRPPFFLESSRPGVFAAGDVRAGSIKRVASAVGEGAMAMQLVHEYLNEM